MQMISRKRGRLCGGCKIQARAVCGFDSRVPAAHMQLIKRPRRHETKRIPLLANQPANPGPPAFSHTTGQ